MKAPVKFAVVGCGHIGKRHAAMIQAATEANSSRWWTTPGRKRISMTWEGRIVGGGRTAHTSLSQALQAHDVDVVAVATPNGSHVELACQAIDAGCHVVWKNPWV